MNREAIATLRDTNDLAAAYEFSRPPGAVFEEALLKAKRELQRARAETLRRPRFSRPDAPHSNVTRAAT